MTDKFYIWFWNRRAPIDKALIIIAPVDILFVASLLLFTSLPGPGIAILTLILTMVTLAIFKLVEFVLNERKAFQEAKDKEAEMIVKKLKGEEEIKTSSEDIIAQLKSYHAVAKKKMIP